MRSYQYKHTFIETVSFCCLLIILISQTDGKAAGDGGVVLSTYDEGLSEAEQTPEVNQHTNKRAPRRASIRDESSDQALGVAEELRTKRDSDSGKVKSDDGVGLILLLVFVGGSIIWCSAACYLRWKHKRKKRESEYLRQINDRKPIPINYEDKKPMPWNVDPNFDINKPIKSEETTRLFQSDANASPITTKNKASHNNRNLKVSKQNDLREYLKRVKRQRTLLSKKENRTSRPGFEELSDDDERRPFTRK